MAFNENALNKIKRKKVLVLGTGITGRSVSQVLSKHGVMVTVFEAQRNDATLERARLLGSQNVEVIFPHDGDFDQLTAKYDLIVPSPGISRNDPYLSRLLELKKEIISEVELAFILLDKTPIIAITGTNGKTTTTELIHSILLGSGKKSYLAGNIGIPFIEIAEEAETGAVICLEVSSFQLAHTVSFRPDVSLITNITEDHLDWHYDFTDYVNAKSKIFLNQEDTDHICINVDCPATAALKPTANVIRFSKTPDTFAGNIYAGTDHVALSPTTSNEKIIFTSFKGQRKAFDVTQTKLIGSHNLENILAAIAATIPFDLDEACVTRVIREYSSSDHRLELVSIDRELRFFNDSKATNPDAAIKAMAAMEENYVLIAGGRNKGNNFTSVADYVKSDPQARQLFKGIVLIGEAASDLANALGTAAEVSMAADLQDAVRKAIVILRKKSDSGGSILFSPACASFDMFNDYKDRGEKFKAAVYELTQG